MQAPRYHGESGGDLVWKHRPVSAPFGRRVILVDDILDEGFTLQGVREWCLEQGATDLRIAVLTVKKHDRCLPGVKADYAGIELPDRFVFGFRDGRQRVAASAAGHLRNEAVIPAADAGHRHWLSV